MDEHDSNGAGGEPSVESLLALWLERRDAGENIEFVDFCSAHPQHADVLRRLAGNLVKFDIALAAVPAGSGDDSGAAFLRAANDRDRYETLEGIGRGAMGEVVAVRDRFLPRTLAMKVALDKVEPSSRGAASSRTIRRFLREAEILAELDHPGIVPVHDLGVRADGRPFFTMRRIKGRDLRAIFALVWAKREDWTATRALNVLLRVCETMAFAHSRGVIHRDLKPANIMVGDFGEVYVVDWGLAKRAGRVAPREIENVDVREDEAATGFGDVIGTPAYMPPEQARGALDELDERADVYAIGAILYELVAGFAPYCEAGTKIPASALIVRIVEKAPLSLSTLRARPPSELVAIAEKAMARDIASRYANMRTLGADLQAYLETRVVAAHETGTWAETKKWVRRNKPLAGTLTATLVIAVVGAIAYQVKAVAAQVSTNRRRDTEVVLAAVQLELGRVYRTSGRYGEALKASRAGIGLREQAAHEEPTSRSARLALCQARVEFGRALHQSGNIAEASSLMQLARQGLEDLEREEPNDRELGVAMIKCLVDLAKASVTTSTPREILEVTDQAVEYSERALAANPDDAELLAAAAGAYVNRAQQSVLERQSAGVEADRDRAIEIYRELLRLSPTDFDSRLGLVTALGILSTIQVGVAPEPAQVARMDEALKLIADLHSQRAQDRQLTMQLIQVRDDRGVSHLAAREYDQAQACFQANVDLLAAIADQLPPDARVFEAQARSWGRLGTLAQARGDVHLMRDCFGKAVASWRAFTQGRDSQDVSFGELSVALNLLGTAQHECEDFESARKNIGEAISIRSRLVDSNPDSAVDRVLLHYCYSAMVRACNAADDKPAQLDWLAKALANFEVVKRLSSAYAALINDIDELTEQQRALQEK